MGKLAAWVVIGGIVGFACLLTGAMLVARAGRAAPTEPQVASQRAEAPLPAATAEVLEPRPDETRRAYVRRLIEEQIADGRAMGAVRELRDTGDPGPMLARQSAHFDRGTALQAYAFVAAREVDAAAEIHIDDIGGAGLSFAEREPFYERPDVRVYARDHAWLFSAGSAIEASRLCGGGMAHAEALVHCARAEQRLVELDAQMLEDFGPLPD